MEYDSYRLCLEERKIIEEKLKLHWNFEQIARMLGRCGSTIAREVQRNASENGYRAEEAQERSLKVRQYHSDYSLQERREIERLLKQGVSHTKIAKFLSRSQPAISREIRKNRNLDSGEYIAETAHSRIGMRSIPDSDLRNRVSNLEMQIEIILDQLKELKCQKY